MMYGTPQHPKKKTKITRQSLVVFGKTEAKTIGYHWMIQLLVHKSPIGHIYSPWSANKYHANKWSHVVCIWLHGLLVNTFQIAICINLLYSLSHRHDCFALWKATVPTTATTRTVPPPQPSSTSSIINSVTTPWCHRATITVQLTSPSVLHTQLGLLSSLSGRKVPGHLSSSAHSAVCLSLRTLRSNEIRYNVEHYANVRLQHPLGSALSELRPPTSSNWSAICFH